MPPSARLSFICKPIPEGVISPSFLSSRTLYIHFFFFQHLFILPGIIVICGSFLCPYLLWHIVSHPRTRNQDSFVFAAPANMSLVFCNLIEILICCLDAFQLNYFHPVACKMQSCYFLNGGSTFQPLLHWPPSTSVCLGLLKHTKRFFCLKSFTQVGSSA